MSAAAQRCQVEFAAVMVAVEIGDDDPESEEAFDVAFAVLVETKPVSMEEAADRLRFLAYVGAEFIGDESTVARIHAGMLQIAAWLALEATARRMAA